MQFVLQFIFCSNRCYSSVGLSFLSFNTKITVLFRKFFLKGELEENYHNIHEELQWISRLNYDTVLYLKHLGHVQGTVMVTLDNVHGYGTLWYRHLNGKSTVVPCEYWDEFINRFALKDCSTLCSRDLFISKNIRRVRRNNIHNSLSYLSGTRTYRKSIP